MDHSFTGRTTCGGSTLCDNCGFMEYCETCSIEGRGDVRLGEHHLSLGDDYADTLECAKCYDECKSVREDSKLCIEVLNIAEKTPDELAEVLEMIASDIRADKVEALFRTYKTKSGEWIADVSVLL